MTWEDEFVLNGENFNLGMDHLKTSYERPDYESVDDNSLSSVMSKKKNPGHVGLSRSK